MKAVFSAFLFPALSRRQAPLATLAVLFLPVLLNAQSPNGPAFVPNGGQWPDPVQYRAEVQGGALFVQDDALVWNFLDWPNRHGHAEAAAQGTGRPSPETLIQYDSPAEGLPLRGHAYRISLEGRSGPLRFQGSEPFGGRVNYLVGNDPSRWATNLRTYRRLEARYAEGMTLALYEQGGNIKYDMIIQPGADPADFSLRYQGQDGLELRDGELHLRTSLNRIVEGRPYAYQEINGKRVTVPCRYRLKGEQLMFEFPEGYDQSRTLVLDPVTWIFGSYSGSTSDNWGYTATFDADGNLYGGGIVFGTGYPVTIGAYQTTWGSGSSGLGCDVGITKFSADGSTNLWSTYLGGTGNEFPHSMIANDAGELWVYGTTGSSNFPVSAGAYDVGFSAGPSVAVTGVNFPLGSDIFVTHLSADGASLLGGTYVGGVSNDGLNLGASTSFNYGDHARGEIILDAAGQPVIASCTVSLDFPTTAGVFQPSPGGGQDGVLFSLSEDLTTLLWSTYFGGGGSDGVYSVKVQADGSLVAGGGSTSNDLPTTPGVILPSYGGSADGFVLRSSADGSTIETLTYLGTPNYDQVYFAALDADGDVYVTGQTRGSAFPISPGVYSVPGSGQFVVKLFPDFSAYEFSTQYGSGSGEINISPTAFLVDICENIYVSGWGGITNTFGTTTGLPVTADALKPSTDGSDFYFTVFSAGMTGLEFASFYGGNFSREHVDGGTSRFDNNGVIYQAVCAGCGGSDDFPTTVGAVSQTNNSSNCNLGVAKIALDFTGVNAALDVEPALIGCLPLTANFINNSSVGVSYVWDFGDGTGISTAFEPSHVYTTPGVFTVQLIASDPASCNFADTAYLTVTVHEDSTLASFDLLETDYCDSLVVALTNTSFTVGTASYAWDFGDGTFSSGSNPTHTYTLPGMYQLQLIVSDPVSCNGGDTLTATITVAPRAIAGVGGGEGCAPLLLEPLNTSIGISPSYTWDFGDGSTATGATTSYTYSTAGTYTLSLYMNDPASCNNGDTATATVQVFENPVASISATPETGSFYQVIEFAGGSPVADEINWDLGNGVTAFGPLVSYQYPEPGEYTVCVTALTAAGCQDTACITVRLDADSELAFPNAFSPNADGINDVVLPFYWGLEGYLLRIFNRWGQVVFESNNTGLGWDGTYLGEPQEVGMYKLTATGKGLDGLDYTIVSDLFLVR